MKLKKFEIAVLAIALIAVIFCAGYLIGRNNPKRIVSTKNGEIIVTTAKSSDNEKKSDEISRTYNDDLFKNPININTASVEALSDLPGIGEVLAQRIVEYRQEHGNFSDISELREVYGIGASKYEMIKDYISVD